MVALGSAFTACSTAVPPPVAIPRPLPEPPPVTSTWEPPPYIPPGQHTVATRLRQFGTAARERWQPWFADAGIAYPADVVVLVGLKHERRLQVYAGPTWRRLAFVRDLPWTATSGGPGPKLREGDRQIPEGTYDIESLNPNSRFHVSLRVGYPNEHDRRTAAREGRTRLGGDIMIHGGDRSIGCIAVGDEAAEDLFVLAADVGLENIEVVLAPRDFRRMDTLARTPSRPVWLRGLYTQLAAALQNLPPATVNTARGGADSVQVGWPLP